MKIRIDEKFSSDPRFLAMCEAVGKVQAYGTVIVLWEIGMAYWKKEKALIPKHIFSTLVNHNLLISIGFVEEKEDGFYCKGAEEYWKSLLNFSKEKQSARGKKSAKSREKRPRNKANNSTNSQPNHNHHSTISEPSLNHTATNSQPTNEIIETDFKKLCASIWLEYETEYEKRYKTKPVRNATTNAQVTAIAKRLGKEAVSVVNFFINHNKGFYIEKCHAIGLCLTDAEALRTQWARGMAITRNDVRDFEKREKTNALLEAIERGEV